MWRGHDVCHRRNHALTTAKRAKLTLVTFTAVALGAAAYWTGRAQAAGIPTLQPLTYSGTLEEGGTSANGMRSMTLRLHDAETAGNVACTTTGAYQVTDGRFSIPLDATCTTAVQDNPDLWVELTVGTDTLPRTKLGAVPYAVEANRAQEAPWTGITGTTPSTEWPGTVPWGRVGDVQTGVIGDCAGAGIAAAGTLVFPTAFSGTPRVFTQPVDSRATRCTSVVPGGVNSTGFSWATFASGSPFGCQCIHWMAVAP